jgi:hypothetical protein
LELELTNSFSASISLLAPAVLLKKSEKSNMESQCFMLCKSETKPLNSLSICYKNKFLIFSDFLFLSNYFQTEI